MLNTACSAMELWPIAKTMFRLDCRALSTSPLAAARSSWTGRGERLIRA